MKKFLKWISKHRGMVILEFIISFFLPLIVINLLFKQNIQFQEENDKRDRSLIHVKTKKYD